MQDDPRFADDVVGEVTQFLHGRAQAAVAAGVAAGKISLDPGIGFGKTLAHNLALAGPIWGRRSASADSRGVLGVKPQGLPGQDRNPSASRRRIGSSAQPAWRGGLSVHILAASTTSARRFRRLPVMAGDPPSLGHEPRPSFRDNRRRRPDRPLHQGAGGHENELEAKATEADIVEALTSAARRVSCRSPSWTASESSSPSWFYICSTFQRPADLFLEDLFGDPRSARRGDRPGSAPARARSSTADEGLGRMDWAVFGLEHTGHRIL